MSYGNNDIIMLIIWLPNTPDTVYWAPGHVSNQIVAIHLQLYAGVLKGHLHLTFELCISANGREDCFSMGDG